MATTDDLKADIKRLSARATQAKMDLHDLSEELPLAWEQIPAIAAHAHAAFAELAARRAELKMIEGG